MAVAVAVAVAVSGVETVAVAVPVAGLTKIFFNHIQKDFLKIAKIFKRPKSREDSSDFDDFLTEWIALTWAIISKNLFRQFF